MTAEERRLEESRLRQAHWKRWGPYVSDRAWGTVREDYSAYGTAWDYLPHDHARSRAYRWNEDGLAGISDRHQELCLAVALWNGRDPILKERLFGLTGSEGNHGEDVKEYYFHLDSTPTHSFMRMLYKYPQRAFPYADLVDENRRRGRSEPEYELIDTGAFDEDRYFDVFVEYAKVDAEDLLMRVTVCNRGPETAPLHVLPTVWFRNTWSWNGDARKGVLQARPATGDCAVIEADTIRYGRRWIYFDGAPELLFTENETNTRRLFGFDNGAPYAKDGINDCVVHANRAAVNPLQTGTKAAAHYVADVPAGGSVTFRIRLSPVGPESTRRHAERRRDRLGANIRATPFDRSRHLRRDGSGLGRARRLAGDRAADHVAIRHVRRRVRAAPVGGRRVLRAGHPAVAVRGRAGGHAPEPRRHAVVEAVLPLRRQGLAAGRPSAAGAARPSASTDGITNGAISTTPTSSRCRTSGSTRGTRRGTWRSTACRSRSSIPTSPKTQLLLMLREWYMHPNGQLPAYEWAFGDVNPPVHAWAAWRVYKIDKKRRGVGDRVFLERVFQKLLLNFTWWVNRKDAEGSNVFEGGFLGLDNIGVFDRSAPLPTGGHIEQSDGTSWMAMYSLNLLAMAMELARENPAYEDVASKFWEHFLYIGHAIGHQGKHKNLDLWDDEDGFFYDTLHTPDGAPVPHEGAVDGRPHPALRRGNAGARAAGAAARLPKTRWTGSSPTGTTSPTTSPACRRRGAASGDCCRSSRPNACSACWRTCSTRTSSSRPTASARSPVITASTRTCCRSTATSIASTTSPANRARGCSAATPTGAARSGSR